MIDRNTLKSEARARLKQVGPEYIKIMLLYVLAAVVVPKVLTTAASGPSEQMLMNQLYQLLNSGIDLYRALELLQIPIPQVMLRVMLGTVLSIYQTVLSFGLAAYTLCLSRGRECGAPELFCGFSMAGRVVGQQLVILALYMLWGFVLSFPLTAVIIFAAMSNSALVFIAGIVGYVVALLAIMLRYDLATLALADQPELGAIGSIRYARALIQGRIGQYFVLLLSFLGWSILCALPAFAFSYALADAEVSPWLMNAASIVLSLPIYLWLVPYVNTTRAGFYDALRAEDSSYSSSPMGPL